MTHSISQLLQFIRKSWQAALIVLFSGTLAVLLTSVVLPEPQRPLVKLAFTLVLLRLAIGDILAKRVPATVTLPWMGVGLARAIGHQDPSFLPFWLSEDSRGEQNGQCTREQDDQDGLPRPGNELT